MLSHFSQPPLCLRNYFSKLLNLDLRYEFVYHRLAHEAALGLHGVRRATGCGETQGVLGTEPMLECYGHTTDIGIT